MPTAQRRPTAVFTVKFSKQLVANISPLAMLATLAFGLGPLWFTVAMLIWAPLVCLARVMTGLHYVSDVLAGILFGIIAGLIILGLQPAFQVLLPLLNIP